METRALIAAILLGEPAIVAKVPDITSTYTTLDLSRCIVLEEGQAYASWRCNGYAGISLFVVEGDLRFDVSAGSERNEGWCSASANCAFNFPGATIEWRLKDGIPFAIIYRLNVSAGENGKRSSYLMVETIGTDGCRVARIDGTTHNANAVARTAADAASKDRLPCIDAE